MPNHHTTPAEMPTPSLRTLLTTLLLVTPPALSPAQLSDDLLMRQRMLGLPSTAPRAYDLSEPSPFAASSSASGSDLQTESQHAFVAWISRPPVELSLPSTDIPTTAESLFFKRSIVAQVAALGEMDPIDMSAYEILCCDAWHSHARLLVRFPQDEPSSASLYMTVIRSKHGGMKLDNLFCVNRADGSLSGLHVWTPDCAQAHEREGGIQADGEEEEQDQGAEYINDAEDFWAGFSDEEEQPADPKTISTTTEQSSGRQTVEAVADQEAAISDIVRGAFILHRSLHPEISTAASSDAFLQLVRSAITPPIPS